MLCSYQKLHQKLPRYSPKEQGLPRTLTQCLLPGQSLPEPGEPLPSPKPLGTNQVWDLLTSVPGNTNKQGFVKPLF